MIKTLTHWRQVCWQHLKAHGGEWLVVLVVLLACNWVLLTREMFYSHDFLHGARIGEMARGLREGQWPVIWSGNFGFGFGMPLFEFYAPLPYLVGAIFHLVGVNLIWCTKILYFLANALTFAGVWFWARQLYPGKKHWLPLLAATAATLASYRAMDIFARGALSEIWAIMALPWLFAGVTKILQGKTGGWWPSVLGGVGVILTHNLTTMMAAPILVGYAIALLVSEALKLPRRKFWQTIWPRLQQLFLAALACLGLGAFYLIPALVEKDLTQINTYILGDYFDYHKHFLYLRQFGTDNFGYGGSGWGPLDGLSFFLGWGQLAGLLIAAVVLISQLVIWCFSSKKKPQLLSPMIVASGVFVLLAATVLLTTEKTQRLWQLLRNWLAYIQFPWRWIGLSLLLVAVLVPYGLSLLPVKWQRVATMVLGAVIIFSSANIFIPHGNYDRLLGVIPTANYFQGETFINEPGHYQADPTYIAATTSAFLVDYLPADFANVADGGWVSAPASKFMNPELQPEVLVDQMHQRLYQFKLEQEQEVEFAIAYYPGWLAEIDGKPLTPSVSPKGNLTLAVPAGEHLVGVMLRTTPVRWWANTISAISLIVIISEGLYHSWRRAKP